MLIKSKAVLWGANQAVTQAVIQDVTTASLPETADFTSPVATATAIHRAAPPPPPPPPPPPAFSYLTKFGRKGLVGGLLLASCSFGFLPQSGFAQCTTGLGSYDAGGSGANAACASSILSVALGRDARAMGTSSTAVGEGSVAGSGTVPGTAYGADSKSTGARSVAFGNRAEATAELAGSMGDTAVARHTNAFALGGNSITTRANQMVFGTVGRIDAVVADNNEETNFTNRFTTEHYRFAGLALSESGIGAEHLMSGETFTALSQLSTVNQINTWSHAQINARNAIIDRYRDAAGHSRVLTVNGHGDVGTVEVDLSNIGTASQDSDGSGTLYQRIASLRGSSGGGSYDDAAVRGLISGNADAIGSYADTASDAESASLHARINKNRADIASFQSSGVSSDTMAQIQGNTQAAARASQGVALSNALSAIPNTLNPGKKLFLGLGVGSFDGKSATAIGVTGKFGASTLLNAGFATGGGESSTRLGIGWEW